jgi:hypothetical protein
MSLDPYVVVSDEPCADCVGSMLVALCGRTDDGSDGPCVLRGDHFGPCYGEPVLRLPVRVDQRRDLMSLLCRHHEARLRTADVRPDHPPARRP